MRKIFPEVKLLFELDPLLVFTVAYICPRKCIPELCEEIHLPYAIALVAKRCQVDDNDWSKSDVSSYIMGSR